MRHGHTAHGRRRPPSWPWPQSRQGRSGWSPGVPNRAVSVARSGRSCHALMRRAAAHASACGDTAHTARAGSPGGGCTTACRAARSPPRCDRPPPASPRGRRVRSGRPKYLPPGSRGQRVERLRGLASTNGCRPTNARKPLSTSADGAGPVARRSERIGRPPVAAASSSPRRTSADTGGRSPSGGLARRDHR